MASDTSTTPRQRPRTALSPPMRLFELWTVVFIVGSLCFHLLMYFAFQRRDWLAFPIDLHRSWMFADFKVFTPNYAFFHTERFFHAGLPMVYPTPVAALFALFFKFGGAHAVYWMVLFCVAAFVVPAALFCRTLLNRGLALPAAVLFVTVICLFSWPADLIVNGANSEVFVWVAMAVAMWAYATGRLWVAAVFLGVAASLKLFPFIFFTLFLNRKHFPKLVIAVLSFVLTFVGALLIVGPTISIAFHGFLTGMAFARDAYFASWRPLEHGVDHSLFGLIKFCIRILHRHDKRSYAAYLKLYQIVMAFAGVMLYFGIIRHRPLLNQILALSIISIYFTPYSGDGTLIHLYYPLIMLFLLSLQASQEQKTVPGLGWIAATMVFCLSMEGFLVIPRGQDSIRFEGPAHAVALGIMLILALRYPLGPPLSAGGNPLALSRPDTGWL